MPAPCGPAPKLAERYSAYLFTERLQQVFSDPATALIGRTAVKDRARLTTPPRHADDFAVMNRNVPSPGNPSMSNPRPSFLYAAASGILILLGLASRSYGGAFEVLQQGARASAQAEAFAAQADDPSAIWYNPAGITQLRGTHITAGGYIVVPDYHFKGAAGNASNHENSLLPELYLVTDLGMDKFRFGVGLNNVFGLKEDWGRNGPLETVFTRGHLYVLNLEPTVAYRVNDHLSVGLGFDIYYGTLNIEHKQVLGAPPTPLGNLRLHGTDYAFGVSPGVMWKIDKRNTLAAFYHSPFTLNVDGQADITGRGLPQIGPSSVKAPIHIPQNAGIGYAFRPIEPLKLEADVVWTGWSTLQQIRIKSPSSVFNNSTILTKYHDTWSFRFGTQYDLTKAWALRAGYAYGTSAAPASTFSPLVPDSNYHIFSAGVGYSTGPWSIDVAYLYILRETRNIGGGINAPAAVGRYNTNLQGFIVNAGFKF
jgi:long-chain fatty acid transport protein